jgi:tape measure domain-containing protein
MSSTDDRIVRMQFENEAFKKKALETKTALADVNKAVDAAGKSKGLLDLSKGMENVAVTASKMQIVTTTALATIANKATNVALNLAKSLTFDPIRQGFSEYESLLTKQNTIMNATGKSAKVVKATLNELNEYSDKTIYSFGNMTDAITKFVNAGVDLDTSVVTIKGIANAAAFAGATSEEASRAMYAFSQSMSLGYVGLNDWMQIENANMGTVQFKTELLKAAEAAGTLTKSGDGWLSKSGSYITATKGWRDGLQEQWATTEVLNTALGKYADTSTKLGKKAFEASQEVRTFTAFMSTLKESIGSGWSQIFTALFGNLEQATTMWTGLSNAVGGVVQGFFGWASTLLQTWRNLGGFEKTLQGFKNILSPIKLLIEVIGGAFRKAFPKSGSGSGEILATLSFAFAKLTRPIRTLMNVLSGKLTISEGLATFGRTMDQLFRRLNKTFGGVFDPIKNLFDMDIPKTGGFVGWIKDLVENVSDAIGKLDGLFSKGEAVKDVFDFGMPEVPKLPDFSGLSLGGLSDGGGIVGALSAENGDKLATWIGGTKDLTKNIEDLGAAGEDAMRGMYFNPDAKLDTSQIQDLRNETDKAASSVKSAGTTVGDALSNMKDGFLNFIEGFSFEDLVASFNLAVVATLFISISRFLNTLTNSFKGFVGTGEAVNGILMSTADALGSFQTTARAKLIIAIAIAIGVLAASLWLLSKIPMKTLALRLVIMAGVFALLDNAMKKLTKMIEAMDKQGMGLKLIAFSVAITAMALSMLLLATAFLIYNKVDIASVIKGLAVMVVTMKLMESLGSMGQHAAKNMIAGAFAIQLIAGAMMGLAIALLLFKLVDLGSMVKAGVVLAALAVAVTLLGKIPAPNLLALGFAMASISFGMVALATALLMLALVKWESIGKLAVVLAALAISMGIMMAIGGPVAVSGMIGLGLAMVAIATAGLMLNKVDWSSIAKVAVILAILVVGFGAFLAVITFFAPALIILSGFAGSLALLALALTGLALAFALVFPLMAASSTVFLAFATGAAVAFAAFLATLAAEAPIIKKAVLDMLQVLIDTIVEAVPMIIQGIKDLWNAVVEELGGGKSGEKQTIMADTGGSWIENLFKGLKRDIPIIVKGAASLIIAFLKALASKASDLAEAGANLIIKLVEGLTRQAGKMAVAAIGLIVAFARGIGDGLDNIVKAGIDLVADFLHSLADNIRTGSGKIGNGLVDVLDAIKDVGVNIVKGLVDGMLSIASAPLDALGSMIEKLPGWAKKLLGISSPSKVFMAIGKFLVDGMTKGIQTNAAAAVVAVGSMVSGQIAIASEYISRFVQNLDQQAIAARAKAEGLALAAEKAAKSAERTKSKKDDRAAERLGEDADDADKAAQRAETRAEKAKEEAQRKEEFLQADTFDKAKMRSEDAQRQLDEAKEAEANAAKNVAAAQALDRQSRAQGVTPRERKALQEEADRLRAEAKRDAQEANRHLAAAKKAAGDALAYQKRAGEEAAAAFQAAFDADAKEAADEAAFEKLSDIEKAELRRKQAADLQIKAQADLEKAKRLAYTDIDSANALAELAQREAEQARRYLEEAQRLSTPQGTQSGGVLGTVVNLDPTEAAALAMSDYSNLYSSATAAAAAARTVEFHQYNTSPESLSPSEIYRQSNNLFNYAVDRINDAVDNVP